jgi:hypothetical protein
MATQKKQPTLQPFKFVVQGVALRVDGTGKVLGEVTTEPVSLYGVEQLKEWADGFEENLARAVAEQQT